MNSRRLMAAPARRRTMALAEVTITQWSRVRCPDHQRASLALGRDPNPLDRYRISRRRATEALVRFPRGPLSEATKKGGALAALFTLFHPCRRDQAAAALGVARLIA